MNLFHRISNVLRPQAPPPGDALYRAIVAVARQEGWYLHGTVPDSVDGRFDMVALVFALVMLRLERAEEHQLSSDLTERFIDDMDGSLRQMAIGDQVVGKHIGRMVSALGGRLGAYRDALAAGADAAALPEALSRNVYRGSEVAGSALFWQEAAVRAQHASIMAQPLSRLLNGEISA